MAIADSEYYDNLDKALKLLASADAQRSKTNSTAGEAMRFYNQFRDSRLSERPALVDTQAMLDATGMSDEDYFGGMNKPRYVVTDNQTDRNSRFGNMVRADGSETGYIVKSDSPIALNHQYVGAGVNSNNNNYMLMPSGIYDGESRYNTSVEVSPEQFEQMQLSMRASLPLPIQLQLLADSYASPNFRTNNYIENILNKFNDGRDVMSLLDEIAFVDPSSGDFANNKNLLAYAEPYAVSDEDRGGNRGRGRVYFPIGSEKSNADAPFYDLAAHEISHITSEPLNRSPNYGVDDYEYIDASRADALLPVPQNLDFNYMDGTGARFGKNDFLPYISEYAVDSGSISESIAEDLALWLKDKEQGWIAQEENILGINTGKKYTFAELYPNRAEYFDRLFGYAE